MASYPNYKRAKNADTAENAARYYLPNSKLLPAVIRAKQQEKLTNELAEMLLLLARRNAQRPCFNGYTFIEDMISEAMANLCQNALKFNPDKGSNPFAFYTTCINNSFIQFLNNEKKHRRIRDQLLIDIGENPSYSFTEEHRQKQTDEGLNRTEIADLKSQIEDARVRIKHENEQEAAKKAAALLESARKELDEKEVTIDDLLEFNDDD